MRPISFDTVSADARRVPATNGAGSYAPAWALVRPVSSDQNGVYTFGQPDTDGQLVWVNGPGEIAVGQTGAVTTDGPAYAYYDSGDGTPAVGETWGAGAGSWKLRKNKGGFKVVGSPDTSLAIVPVERVGASSPLTTKGDLWGYSTTDVRVAVGKDGYVLTADSTATEGVKWAAASGSGLADGDYGDITVSKSGTVWEIDPNAVGDAEFRQSAGLSVVGRSANSTGNVADITAGSDYYCLRRDGTSIGFGVLAIQGGGTGKATQAAGFDALSPTTKAGDLIVHDGANNVRLAVGTDGYVLTANSKTVEGVSWAAAGSGTVTSVAASGPSSFLTWTGSPVTTSGTLTAALDKQSANGVFAGPTSGGAAVPTFRSLVTADASDGMVTYPKIQDVTAASRILGRGSAAGSGDVQEMTVTAPVTISGTAVAFDLTPDTLVVFQVIENVTLSMVAGNLRLAKTLVEYTAVLNASDVCIGFSETDRGTDNDDVAPCVLAACCFETALSVAPSVSDSGAGTTATAFDFSANRTGGGGGYTFAWTFPGGTPATSSAENPADVTFTTGTHEVSLTVTDQCGNTDTDTVTVVVYCEDYDAGGIHMAASTPGKVWQRNLGPVYQLKSPAETLADWTFDKDGTTVWEPAVAGWDGTGCRTFTRTSGSDEPETLDVCCGWDGYCEEYVAEDVSATAMTQVSDSEWSTSGTAPYLYSPMGTGVPDKWVYKPTGTSQWVYIGAWDGTGCKTFTYDSGDQGSNPTEIEVCCNDP